MPKLVLQMKLGVIQTWNERSPHSNKMEIIHITCNLKKSSPVTGLGWPRGFQEVKIPRVLDKGTGWWWVCQPYAPAAFTSRKYSWYSFLLEAESTAGPWCDQKDLCQLKIPWHHLGKIKTNKSIILPAFCMGLRLVLLHWGEGGGGQKLRGFRNTTLR
jgi:hypothetical protein